MNMSLDKMAEQMIIKHVFFNVQDIVRNDIYEDFALNDDESEICQLWAVDYFLGEKLYAKGEAVIFHKEYCVWGRTTAGQAIWQDEVIRRIANEG